MTSQTLYDILGVLEDASPEDVKAAYRRKMQHLHPDRGGSEEAAAQVNAAYDTLSDTQQRAKYDASRRREIARCPLCDDFVHSEDELVGHLIRHRAEVEAAQAIIATDIARPSQDVPSSDVLEEDDSDRSVPDEGAPERSASQSSNPRSTKASFMLAVAAVAAIAAVIILPNVLTQPSSGDSLSSSTVVAQQSTGTTRGSGSTATIQRTSTSGTSAIDASEPWPLAQSGGDVDQEGFVDGPWSQTSEAWNQYFADRGVLTLGGVPGFRKVFDGCLDDLCDYWLVGLDNSGEQAWLVMEYGLTTQVLRFTLSADESVGLCRSLVYDGPVVVATNVGAVTNRVMAVNRAWIIPGWSGDGLWKGIDASVIDSANVEPFPFRTDPLGMC